MKNAGELARAKRLKGIWLVGLTAILAYVVFTLSMAIENCALSTWCRIPRFGVEVVGLGGAVGNRVGAATIKSLARQPGYP